jgi:3'-phosphoadenosine 5'-phosphosulfate sulfotransferase
MLCNGFALPRKESKNGEKQQGGYELCKGKKYTASDVSKAERHNERKNETYENMNVIEERIPFNMHFKTPTAPTYMEQLKQMETDGLVSLRGLRKDATLFNEIVIDVNTMYFERNGGYEYAKQFYEEAIPFYRGKIRC